MVLFYKKKQQKNRSFIKFNEKFKLKFGHIGVLAVSSGFMSFRMISNFIVRFKKMFKLSKSITKFWFYLFTFFIVSKKPLNVRMGKGKGSRKGLLSLVKSGNSIIELKYCRLGLFKKIFRCISVRCSFFVNYIFKKTKSINNKKVILNFFKKAKFIRRIPSKSCRLDRLEEIRFVYENINDFKMLRMFERYHDSFDNYLKIFEDDEEIPEDDRYFNFFNDQEGELDYINFFFKFLKKLFIEKQRQQLRLKSIMFNDNLLCINAKVKGWKLKKIKIIKKIRYLEKKKLRRKLKYSRFKFSPIRYRLIFRKSSLLASILRGEIRRLKVLIKKKKIEKSKKRICYFMILYIKFFFLLPKVIHYYFFFYINIINLFKFNNKRIFIFIKSIINLSNNLYSYLHFFNENVIFNKVKTLSPYILKSNLYISRSFYDKSFQNIFIKNIVNKQTIFGLTNSNDVDSFLLFFENIQLKKINILGKFSFKIDIYNFKFNYFLLLINSNWHLILNFNNIFRSVRQFISANVRLYGGRQYGVFSISFLWKFWNNYFNLIFNISFYNVPIISFSKIYFKKITEMLNWLSWSYSFSTWKKFSSFFFFKYSYRNQNSFAFLKNFKILFDGLIFISDCNYHYCALQIFKRLNLYNIAILDVNLEPWLSWYPIPGRGSDITLQYMFLVLLIKLKLMGLNLYLFFKLNYIFLLRLINFLQLFKNFCSILPII